MFICKIIVVVDDVVVAVNIIHLLKYILYHYKHERSIKLQCWYIISNDNQKVSHLIIVFMNMRKGEKYDVLDVNIKKITNKKKNQKCSFNLTSAAKHVRLQVY